MKNFGIACCILGFVIGVSGTMAITLGFLAMLHPRSADALFALGHPVLIGLAVLILVASRLLDVDDTAAEATKPASNPHNEDKHGTRIQTAKRQGVDQ